MLLFCIVLTVSSVKGSSSNTVVTYTNKTIEVMPCVIDENTASATWKDVSTDNFLYTYIITSPNIQERDLQPKHENFRYSYVPNSHLNLIIDKLEREDEGTYSCDVTGLPSGVTVYHITVEAIPEELSLDCLVPPDVTCPAQGVYSTSELICTCAAKGVHPDTLSLNISGADNVQQDSPEANDDLFDISLTETVPVTDFTTEVTCSVNGYNTTGEPIPPNLITKTFVISPPTCALDISFDQDCKGATLSCSCSAIPTDGESGPGMVFSYFNAVGDIIAGNTTRPFQINDIEAGVNLTYSCRGCNGLYYGVRSYITESKVCTISTTALPTTTITTVHLSTNEPTSTKAMGTTTVEPQSKSTDNPESGGFGTGAIVGISLGTLAVVIVIVLIALMMFKPGKCGSKSDSSYATDGNSTAKDIDIYEDELSMGSNEKTDEKMRSNIDNGIVNDGMETPLPIYAEVKKKSNKQAKNGASPGVDPEMTTNRVVYVNTVKYNDPTPGPCSSTRDTINSSKHPKQEKQNSVPNLGQKQPSNEEKQNSDPNLGRKPPSNEML